MLCAAAMLVCAPAAVSVVRSWSQIEFYSHGALVVGVALWLVFSRRAQIAPALRTVRPTPLGTAAVVVASLLVVAALALDATFVAGIGVPLVLTALASALGGAALLRPLALPLIFVALAVPLPLPMIVWATGALQLFASQAAVALLQLGGVDITADGNVLHLAPDIELFVAEACSGLTSIVTLVPLAALVAAFGTETTWRRVLVIACVLPLALAGNLVRIIVTTLAVSRYGLRAAEGSLHELMGLVIYVGAALVLVAVARWGGPAEAAA